MTAAKKASKKRVSTSKRAKKSALSSDAVRRRVLKKVAKMTKAQRIQSLVDAGILTNTHRVAKVYRDVPVLSHREPLATSK